jgi:hypothetical protein
MKSGLGKLRAEQACEDRKLFASSHSGELPFQQLAREEEKKGSWNGTQLPLKVEIAVHEEFLTVEVRKRFSFLRSGAR